MDSSNLANKMQSSNTMDYDNNNNNLNNNYHNNHNNNNVHGKYTRKHSSNNNRDRMNHSNRISHNSSYGSENNNKEISTEDTTLTDITKKQFNRQTTIKSNNNSISRDENDDNMTGNNNNNDINNGNNFNINQNVQHHVETVNTPSIANTQNNVLRNVEVGKHVQIKTKQGEVIDGIVYCSNPIPNPPLCMIYEYGSSGHKSLHIVALNQIIECTKVEDSNVNLNRGLTLKACDEEAIERKLRKNIDERKQKMVTFNHNVDPKIQDLFDHFFKIMPQGQCEWRGNDILLQNQILIKNPYQSLSSEYDYSQPPVKYITNQLNQFWSKMNHKNINNNNFLDSSTQNDISSNFMNLNVNNPSINENNAQQTTSTTNNNNNHINNDNGFNETNQLMFQQSSANTSHFSNNQRSRFNSNNNRLNNNSRVSHATSRTPKNDGNQNSRNPNKRRSFRHRGNNNNNNFSRFSQNNVGNDIINNDNNM